MDVHGRWWTVPADRDRCEHRSKDHDRCLGVKKSCTAEAISCGQQGGPTGPHAPPARGQPDMRAPLGRSRLSLRPGAAPGGLGPAGRRGGTGRSQPEYKASGQEARAARPPPTRQRSRPNPSPGAQLSTAPPRRQGRSRVATRWPTATLDSAPAPRFRHLSGDTGSTGTSEVPPVTAQR
jgi:hypothetical protein